MLNLANLLRVPQVDTGLRFDISPDGRNVVFAWNKTGNWEIYQLPTDAPQHLHLGLMSTAPPAPLSSEVTGAKFCPQYSPDGKHIAYALDLDGSESYHIVLQDLGTGSHIDLTPSTTYAHQPNFTFSPDGKTLAVLSDEQGQFALYLFSVDTGAKKLLLDIQRPIWDVRWSPDGKWIAAEAEMEASDRGIFLVGVESGKWKQIEKSLSPSAHGEAPQWGSQMERGLNSQQPAWSPDSKFLAFSAESDEWFDIGIYDLEAGTIAWLTQSIGDDTSPCWSQDGKRISWLHAEGAANSLCIRDIGGGVEQYRVSAGIHHHPKFSPEGEILFIFESPVQPPDLWRLRLDGTFEQLTNSLSDDFHKVEFVMPEEVSYAHGGVCVPALLYRGSGDRAVVNVHGGPNWHVQFLWDPVTAHMVSRGWTVLSPNYRGSTGYGRAWQIASRFDMGGVDTQDCAAGAQYLKCETQAQNIAITGRSHGGYLTMTCLTQYPELWCGGSAVVPFLNWFKSHEDSREDLQHWNIENMGDPEENYERWFNASPYFFVDRVNAPVQLICGANDPRCPASESIAARDKLTKLGKEVELLLYEEEGHSFLKIENVIDAELKRVEFLARVLETKKT